jgi:hypothetical protein
MDKEFIVNDVDNPIAVPIYEGVYTFPQILDGQIVSFVTDAGGGQEAFDYHREKFLKKILTGIVNRKPKVSDYIKFDVYVLNGKEVVMFDRIAWGEISYKIISKHTMSCEYMFTKYPPSQNQLDLF